MKTWADVGIELPPGRSGEIDVVCPECSGQRKKSGEKCLSVNTESGVWQCFHCGWAGGLGGDGGRLTWNPPAAVYQRPAPPAADDLPASVAAWFERRGIPRWVLDENRISAGPEFCPQLGHEVTAIRFPYFRGGELVNIKYRAHPKHFWMSKGAERILYGLDGATDAETICIVEGEMDKLAIDAVNGWPALSVPDGAPAPDSASYASKFSFLAGAAPVFAGAKRVILATDMDAPGRKLADELARRIGPEKCFRARWPDGCKDANDTLTRHGEDAVRIALNDAQPYPVDGIFTVRDLADEIDRLYEEGYDRGRQVGWPSFDRHYRSRPGVLTIVTGIPGHGKALDVLTPLPTPTGWMTMGAVQEGDELLDEQGKPCRVVAATEMMHGRPCYRVRFSDGSEIICDAEHQWLTRNDKARRSEALAVKRGRQASRPLRPRGTDQTHLRTHPSVKTTREIAATLLVEHGRRRNHAVAVAAPLNLPDVLLPIDPYVLGAWLGDGHSQHGGITTADEEILDHIKRAGFTVTKWGAKYAYGIKGLKQRLRQVGVLGEKHIPVSYLRASERHRWRLLQGLMDTDGHAAKQGNAEFTSCNERLARNVYELIASLGGIPTLSEGRATIAGRDCGPKYRVIFQLGPNAFGLSRKRERCTTAPRATTGWRYIVACDPVPSVPVRCVQVDSPSHLYLAGHAMIPTHNSVFLDNLMVRLASQHRWRVAICSPENQPLARHASKLLAIYLGKPFDDGPTPRMTKAEAQAARLWLERFFTFVLPEQPTVDAILERARLLVYREGITGLVIDPWNEVEHSRPAAMTETEYVSQALTRLRNFGRTHGVAIWLVAHPTKLRRDEKTGAVPVPTPYDISGSANFFNKADACLAVHRDKQDETRPSEVHVQKMRFQELGQIGTVEFRYDKATGAFREIGGSSGVGGDAAAE